MIKFGLTVIKLLTMRFLSLLNYLKFFFIAKRSLLLPKLSVMPSQVTVPIAQTSHCTVYRKTI